MKAKYLFSHKFKKIGWIILIPSVVLGFLVVLFNYEPDFLDFNVPALVVEELMGEREYFGLINNNILNEIFGILIIISSILVAFSKEKIEDELISKIRLESLVWATYVNYGILIVAIIFVFDISFLWVMIFNMFTILLIFIIRFNWQVSKFKKAIGYEE